MQLTIHSSFPDQVLSKIINNSSQSFLLKLTGFGEAEMIEYYDQIITTEKKVDSLIHISSVINNS